jgi:phosphatidate cytidylyltransferase
LTTIGCAIEADLKIRQIFSPAIRRKKKRIFPMLKTRVLTALALLAVFVPAGIWLPDRGWAILVAVIVALAAWEWAGLMGFWGKGKVVYGVVMRKGKVVYGVVMLVLMLVGEIVSLEGELAGRVFFTLVGISGFFWIVVAPLFLRFRWEICGFPGLLLGGVILLPFWCEFTVISNSILSSSKYGSRMMLLNILLIIWIADISAYFVGRTYGKHKLAPSISPGKTWEGAIGAVIGVTLFMKLEFHHGRWGYTMVVGGLVTVTCILGDLFESLMKRQAGVKDSSNLLPGHGGILDCIDSWLPLFTFLPMILFVALSD